MRHRRLVWLGETKRPLLTRGRAAKEAAQAATKTLRVRAVTKATAEVAATAQTPTMWAATAMILWMENGKGGREIHGWVLHSSIGIAGVNVENAHHNDVACGEVW